MELLCATKRSRYVKKEKPPEGSFSFLIFLISRVGIKAVLGLGFSAIKHPVKKIICYHT